MKRTKGIIFDMDNTLLQSHIDYGAMKHDTFQFLVTQDVLTPDLTTDIDLDQHTTATVIQLAEQSGKLTEPIEEQMWNIVKKHEVKGMDGASLEFGVTELLDQLYRDQYILTVLTNNSVEAAEKALRDQQIRDYFDLVVGRETTQTLKPSPAGVQFILDQYPDLNKNDWLSIGDAWIDGLASERAGVPFISYQTELSVMHHNGVYPKARISNIGEILHLLQNGAIQ